MNEQETAKQLVFSFEKLIYRKFGAIVSCTDPSLKTRLLRDVEALEAATSRIASYLTERASSADKCLLRNEPHDVDLFQLTTHQLLLFCAMEFPQVGDQCFHQAQSPASIKPILAWNLKAAMDDSEKVFTQGTLWAAIESTIAATGLWFCLTRNQLMDYLQRNYPNLNWKPPSSCFSLYLNKSELIQVLKAQAASQLAPANNARVEASQYLTNSRFLELSCLRDPRGMDMERIANVQSPTSNARTQPVAPQAPTWFVQTQLAVRRVSLGSHEHEPEFSFPTCQSPAPLMATMQAEEPTSEEPTSDEQRPPKRAHVVDQQDWPCVFDSLQMSPVLETRHSQIKHEPDPKLEAEPELELSPPPFNLALNRRGESPESSDEEKEN